MIGQSASAPYSQKRLHIYSSMPPGDSKNYKKLKSALLQQYELTEDGFCQKFRENQPDVGETVFQFVAQLRRFFTRWTDMVKFKKTSFDGFSGLLIHKQFLNMCAEEMVPFLKERVVESVEEKCDWPSSTWKLTVEQSQDQNL